MTEGEWTDEIPEQKTTAKSGVPVWVWGCGGCGLLALIAGIVLVVGSVKLFSGMMDPDVQWPRMAKYLPHEERPQGFQVFGLSIAGFETVGVVDAEGGKMALLMSPPGGEQQGFDELFDPNFEGGGSFMGLGGVQNPEHGTIEIDGRETRCVRFMSQGGNAVPGAQDSSGPSMFLDLQGEGDRPVLLQYTNMASNEPVTDEEVQDFLDRLTYDAWHRR